MSVASLETATTPELRWFFIRADRLPFKRSGCRKCGTVQGYIGRYIQASGQTRLRWVCDLCEDYFTCGDLPQHVIGDFPIETLKIICDNSRRPADDPFSQCRCIFCNAPWAQIHHWAVRDSFEGIWPDEVIERCTAPMCEKHHAEWHQVMRDCGHRWRYELELA